MPFSEVPSNNSDFMQGNLFYIVQSDRGLIIYGPYYYQLLSIDNVQKTI